MKKKQIQEKINQKKKNKRILVEEDNFEKARKKIRENKNKEIIFVTKDDMIGRKILEKEKIDIFLIKQKDRKDKMKQRDAGLDLVMAKLAKKNNISIGIYLDEIIEAKEKGKSEIISRVIQNVKICNKKKVKMKFIALKSKNKRDLYDLKSLGIVLGMPTWMIKDL